MKILSSTLTLLSSFDALGAARGGGRTESVVIPLLHGEVDLPPDTGLDALILLSDMQHYETSPRPGQPRRLISHVLAEELFQMGEAGLIPPPAFTGIVMAGDFHADANLVKRGGKGDVQDVWMDFAAQFRWVAGVAGNHDLFHGEARFPNSFIAQGNIHALHGESVRLDEIKIAGFSGVYGNPVKPWRNREDDLRRTITDLLAGMPDVLLLHQGPCRGNDGAMPDDAISVTLAAYGQALPLVIFGHEHWPEPLNQRGATTLLNVDSRVVLLTRAGGGPF